MLGLLREPLFHFLLLGGALCALFALTREPAESVPRDEIVIRAPMVDVWERFADQRR